VLQTAPCSTAAASGDGRGIFTPMANGQLKMPHLGNYCVTMASDGATFSDLALTSTLAATSANAQHAVQNLINGDAQSYWASAFETSGPVDVQFDFGSEKQVAIIEIDWENPALAYELQVASAGKWGTVYSTSGNNLRNTKYVGPTFSGTALRIRMTAPHPTLSKSGGQILYAIKSVRIFGSSTRAIVQDCAEAEDNADSRDKFFMVAVPELDLSTAAVVKQQAVLLRAAEEHLGKLLVELYVAMPSLAACGFKSSFSIGATSFSRQARARSVGKALSQDAASIAMAAVEPALGIDMEALRALVTDVGTTLTKISR